MSKHLRSKLPKSVHKFLFKLREQYFFKQGFTKIKCGSYEIEAPKNHALIDIVKRQPYRDLCIGITAKYISAKYPDGTIIDIGANIGDTAAMIATYAKNKLILVEASDYFFEILSRNTLQLPNNITLKKALMSDGSKISGSFRHWGGTSYFDEKVESETQIKTERLSNIADENTCFIKTDTDGYDFRILLDSLEWLASVHPAIIFENQIRNNRDFNSANELYARLMQIGYTHFIVWDDPGFHLLSTTSLDVLTDLNHYMFKVFQNNGHKSIYNYDVLCLYKNDKDVYKDIYKLYKSD